MNWVHVFICEERKLTVVLDVFGVMVQNLVILVPWHLGFVHPPE